MVCNPTLMYNGHTALTQPHAGSDLVLGCDGDGNGAGTWVASNGTLLTATVIPTTIGELPALVAARRESETPPTDVVVYTIPQVWSCNQADPWRGLPAKIAMCILDLGLM